MSRYVIASKKFPEFVGIISGLATVNKEMHTGVLMDAVRRKHPEKWRTNSWFLLHDNAPAHRSVSFKDFLAKNDVTTLELPLYSPDVAPADFYLFPRLK